MGTGIYLPKRNISSKQLDKKFCKPDGYMEKKYGVETRYYVDDETSSYMGAEAIKDALRNSCLNISDIDCIVCASGTQEQPIPCTASLIQAKLKCHNLKTPCFDINSTCLSFVVALDIVSCLISAGKYKKVAIVSTEISSKGLNWNQEESCILFGDGAAAVIVGSSRENNGKFLGSLLQTNSEGAHFSEIVGGGTKLPSLEYESTHQDEFTFTMNGRKLFKKVCEDIEVFNEQLLKKAGLRIEDISYVVPHQASFSAMELIRKRLKVPKEKWANIIFDYGNMIAASIPLALHLSIKNGKINRGDKVMLLGTSAGISIGGVIFEY